ncbi:hypothetical protein CEP88_09465 [Roseobacter denitrificans]|nr:hypothetical protein CEP88_09465 [Roseobacter denitrificans]
MQRAPQAIGDQTNLFNGGIGRIDRGEIAGIWTACVMDVLQRQNLQQLHQLGLKAPGQFRCPHQPIQHILHQLCARLAREQLAGMQERRSLISHAIAKVSFLSWGCGSGIEGGLQVHSQLLFLQVLSIGTGVKGLLG